MSLTDSLTTKTVWCSRSVHLSITRKLLEAGKLLDLLISDHIILTKRGCFSFGDEGLL